MGWDLWSSFLLKPASLRDSRRQISEKSIKITVRRDHRDEVGDLCSVRGHFDLPHQGEAAFKIKAMRAENNMEGGGREVKLAVIAFTPPLVIFHIRVEDEEENLLQNLGPPHGRLKPPHLDPNIAVLNRSIRMF